ncbi:hypothetical protein MSG28_004425 [Choristoneura fumiferana]|uniref:Uncharacterized protein n=1 Tax=Choristoneura fumiferana TaxID=7141 RepID=A0ACC0K754_CHOFU|nr:hypothetical protein MSG28_004425 [Choristoneura fumiferana]
MSNLWKPYALDAEIRTLDHCNSTKDSTTIKEEPLCPAPIPPLSFPPQAPVSYGYYVPAIMELTLPPMMQSAFQVSGPPHNSPSAISIVSNSELYSSEYLNNNSEYLVFERDALRAMAERNGGSLVGSNPRMRRTVEFTKVKDGGYRQQRELNNAAAKLSRERRKLREVKLALKVSFLEKKIRKLQAMLASDMCEKCIPDLIITKN